MIYPRQNYITLKAESFSLSADTHVAVVGAWGVKDEYRRKKKRKKKLMVEIARNCFFFLQVGHAVFLPAEKATIYLSPNLLLDFAD